MVKSRKNPEKKKFKIDGKIEKRNIILVQFVLMFIFKDYIIIDSG